MATPKSMAIPTSQAQVGGYMWIPWTVSDEVEQVECISFTHTVVLSKVNMGTLL